MDSTTFLVALVTFVAAVQAGAGPQKYSFNLMVGSGSGTPFKSEGMGRISGVRIWDNGYTVNGIQLRYGDIWSATVGVSYSSLRMHEFELYDDEAIIQVSGKYAQYLSWIMIGTSKGRFFVVGQPSGSSFNFYPEHYGAELRFISGRFSRAITGFSCHWGLAIEPDFSKKGF